MSKRHFVYYVYMDGDLQRIGKGSVDVDFFYYLTSWLDSSEKKVQRLKIKKYVQNRYKQEDWWDDDAFGLKWRWFGAGTIAENDAYAFETKAIKKHNPPYNLVAGGGGRKTDD